MAKDDDKFLAILREAFLMEAQDQLQGMSKALLELEKQPGPERQVQLVESIFREAHNLKGSARATNFPQTEGICHPLESLFQGLKNKTIPLSVDMFDVVHQAITAIGNAIETEGAGLAVDASMIEGLVAKLELLSTGSEENQVSELVRSAQSSGSFESIAAIDPETNPSLRSQAMDAQPQDTLRVKGSKLELILAQAQEMIAFKNLASQRHLELLETQEAVKGLDHLLSTLAFKVRVASRMQAAGGGPENQQLLNQQLSSLDDIGQSAVEQAGELREQFQRLIRATADDTKQISNIVGDLIDETRQLLMISCSTVFDALPKMVREVSRELGKEVDLQISGGAIELDKFILLELKDAIIHLVRNSIDHGIEHETVRKDRGKPAVATLSVIATQPEASVVEIIIKDDGGGIDIEKVVTMAVKQGLITAEEAQRLSRHDAMQLIFQSSLSTSAIITELSGRGLGLAIVKEKAIKLGGTVIVESVEGEGTTFKLRVPITNATVLGTLVAVGQKTFIVPTRNLERVLRITRQDIITLDNGQHIKHNDRFVSLCFLGDLLKAEHRLSGDNTYMHVLIFADGDHMLGCIVDAIMESHEVLIKGLPRPLIKVTNIAGISIIGSGQIVPVLNVPELFETFRTTASSGAHLQSSRSPKDARVLVVDDTLTARMLIKSILESGGYAVQTANDGAEALALLKKDRFDIVISDVEMPNLNGFELCANIRDTESLADLPVILVTALASKEDRERGVEVGANAYFVKSSFDQTNLLDVVTKLI